jgi:hypothetical protein
MTMTDQDNAAREGASTTSGTGAPSSRAGESQWSEPAPSGQAREWLTQLQSMIENLTEQAVPVVREIGAKAAELAAVAAEKAGPAAARAAEVTADVGTKIAERSRSFATELRRDAESETMRPDAGGPSSQAASDTLSGASVGSASSTSEGDASRPIS